MANYDRELLQSMCDKINLLEYASQSIDFRKHGDDSFAAHCPLHVDKTPSLTITPSRNLFHCFSCGRGGTIVQWLMIFEHMSFNSAVEKVSRMSGVDIKHLKQCSAMSYYKDMQRMSQANDSPIINRKVLDFSSDYEQVFSNEIPAEWLNEGISAEALRKFHIRIDNNSNRIVYPVFDNNDQFVGIKGRTRFENYKVLKIPKYMNYTKIQTTNFFVGMKENRQNILNHSEIIIVEGIKSVMKLYDYGYDWCVASETSCLNDDQIRIIIQSGVKSVVIAFDNDVDINKTLKCVQTLRRFTNVYVVKDRPQIDRRLLTEEKLAPCDKGKEVWEILYKERKKL